MTFEDFKKKYFGKNVEEIKEELKSEKDFWKKINNMDIVLQAQFLSREILNFEHTLDYFYIFQKMYVIFVKGLEMCTNVQNLPEEISFDDYNIIFDKVFEEVNSYYALLKKMINEILQEERENRLDEIYEAINSTSLSTDELEKVQNKMNSMFSEESTDRLQLIESILAYNDPSLKQIKDFIYNPNIVMKNEKNEKVQNKNNKLPEDVSENLKKTENAAKNITNKINNTIAIKEINEKIQEEQKQRLIKYNEEFNKNLDKK